MKKNILLFLFRKKQTCLLILLVFLFIFLFKAATVASAACSASLTPACGGADYTGNTLKATWDLGSHDPASRCHVIVWGGSQGTPGYVNWDQWGTCSGNGVTVTGQTGGFTDNGDYNIQISNDEAGCNPSQVWSAKFPNCHQTVAPPCDANAVTMTVTPSQGTVGSQMKFSVSGSQGSTFVDDSWSAGVNCTGGFWGDKTCNATSATTDGVWTHKWKNCAPNDCTKTSAQCSKTQNYTVGGSGTPPPSGSCPVDNKLTVSPSQPKVGDTLTFQYQAGEDVYIGGDTWSGGVNPNPCTLDSNLGNRRYTCTAQSAVTNATWNHYWNNKANCGSATYTVTGATPSPTSTPTPSSTPTPTPAPAFTTKFRIAENPTDLAVAPWQAYTTVVASTPLDYTFRERTPGQKFIFVQFMDSTGKVTTTIDCPKCQVQIKLLGPDPVMTGCSLSFEDSNTILNLTGQNFGSDKGTVKSGDTDLAIRSWKNDSIQAILQNAPTGQVLPVTFINTDEQTGSGQCSSISQLSLGAKVFCRAPASYDTDNVYLVLVDETGRRVKQTVRIDKNGIVQGLTQRLEDGKRYMLSVKAPKSLKRNVPFTAGGGTVSIPNFVLPVGDIFPADGGDGAINALDKSELNREWNISGNATGRPGDFNQDGKVNSIDWACMRYDFGQLDDPEPTIPPPPSPSPSVSASPSPSATASPSPSPSPSP